MKKGWIVAIVVIVVVVLVLVFKGKGDSNETKKAGDVSGTVTKVPDDAAETAAEDTGFADDAKTAGEAEAAAQIREARRAMGEDVD